MPRCFPETTLGGGNAMQTALSTVSTQRSFTQRAEPDHVSEISEPGQSEPEFAGECAGGSGPGEGGLDLVQAQVANQSILSATGRVLTLPRC